MPAVGYVLLLRQPFDQAEASAALQVAVPGLMLGPVSGAQWPVASWAEQPNHVQDQAEALRTLAFVMDVEIAYVDWRGDPTSDDMQFDWNDLRRGQRRADPTALWLDPSAP